MVNFNINEKFLIKFVIFTVLIGVSFSSGYKNPNYLMYKFVTIFNIQGNCRYCKVWIDSTTIGFNQCLLSFSQDQRSHIVKGSSSCNNISIANSLEHSMFLKSGNNRDLEIISVNSDGGVAIRDPITDKCLTHNPNDNIVKPYGLTDNQLFTTCLPFNSDINQVFYFSPYKMESTNIIGCKSPTSVNVEFKLYETTWATFSALDNAIQDNSDITITGPYNYTYNVGTNHSNNSFTLLIEEGTYEIDLTLRHPLLFTFTKFSVDILSTTTIVQIDVTDLKNLVTINLLDYFNNPVTTNLFSGSFIFFTNGLDNSSIHQYTIIPNSNIITTWLRWGNYPLANINASVIADWEKVTSTFDINISSSSDTKFTFQLREQKVDALIKIKNSFDNTFTNTSIFVNTSIFRLTRTSPSTGVQYDYTIIDGTTTDIPLTLHFGTYSISATFINGWEIVSTQVQIVDFLDINKEIIVKETQVNALIKIKDTFTNLYTNTSVFVNSSIFRLTRTNPATSVQYDYTIINGTTTDIPITLHFGTYSITSTFVPEWQIVSTQVQILNSSDINKEIIIKETVAPVNIRFKSIEAGSHDEYVDHCLFANGSTITFTRTVGGLNNTGSKIITIASGCLSAINDTMEKGTYTFSYSSLSADVNSLLLKPNQTFIVNNYVGNNIIVDFDFYGASSHFYFPIWDYYANTYITEYGANCPTGYVLRNFFASNAISIAITLHWVCKRVKYTTLTTHYTSYVTINYGLDTFLNQNVSCPSNGGIKRFNIEFNGSSQYRISYDCHDVLNYTPSNCVNENGTPRDYQNNNYALGNVHIGYGYNYLNAFTVTGTPGGTQSNVQNRCRTVKNYSIFPGALKSTPMTSTFELLANLSTDCTGNSAITYFLYFYNTIGLYMWYLCRDIPSGGTITNYYTASTTSNLNSALTALYLDCPNGEILKNIFPEWDPVISSFRLRLECVTISRALIFKDQFITLNNGCETSDKTLFNGISFGDMNNFIKGIRFNMNSGSCYGYTKIAVDILYG